MSTYREIVGKKIKKVSADPSAGVDGEMWYNSTTGTLRGPALIAAWSSAATLPGNRTYLGGAGTQTAALAFGGALNPPGTAQSGTFEYDGSGWSSGGDLPAASDLSGGMGTLTAALKTFGRSGGPVTAEAFEYDGSTWTAGGDGGTARWGVGSAGTQTAGLAFGGFTTPPHTWYANAEEYNGSSWSEVGDLSTARSQVGFLGDGQTSALCVGGETPPSFAAINTVEGWNGSAWVSETNYPGVSQGGVGTGSESDGYFFTPSPNSTNSFSYDGSAWTAGASLATGRQNGARAGTTTAALAFGGNDGSGGNFTEEYNNSTTAYTAAAWASGGNYPINSGDFSGAGTTTASIAFGGRVYPGPNAVTGVSATYDGASWTAGPSLTTARMLAASAKNGTTTAALCTGGSEPSLSDKCEEFNGSSWTEGPNYPTTAQFGDQGVGIQTAALISGGYGGGPGSAYLDATSTYNGSSWTALSAPSNLQDSRFSATATGTSTAALMMAGTGGAGKVESWNGSAWSEQAEAITARTAGGSSGTSTDTLYFGGEGPTGVTEGWDGTAWSTRPTMGTARFSLASCGTSTLALATGGFTSSNSTEEFTGETTSLNIKDFATS